MKPLPHACCVLITAVASTLAAGGAWAKLPQPSDEAKAKDWTVISMKKDWKRVFAFD